jgi:hypothetical protein
VAEKLHWLLSSPQDLGNLLDEFVVNGCRVRLIGASLLVEPLTALADPVLVAEEYISVLARWFPLLRRLIPADGMFVQPVTVTGSSKQETDAHRARLQEARQLMVEPYHARLSKCYDYLQSARYDSDHALWHLYKMIEIFEDQFGGERNAIRVLGPVLKDLKKLANENTRDERHAPKDLRMITRLTIEAQGRALQDGHSLLRKFENTLLYQAVCSALLFFLHDLRLTKSRQLGAA